MQAIFLSLLCFLLSLSSRAEERSLRDFIKHQKTELPLGDVWDPLDAIDDEFCCAGSARLRLNRMHHHHQKRFLCAQFHAHTVCFIEGWARDIILWMKKPTLAIISFPVASAIHDFCCPLFSLLLFAAASFAVRPHYECSFRGNHNLIALRCCGTRTHFVQEAERHKQTWEMTDRRGSRWGCGSIGAEDRDAHEMMRMKERIMRKKSRVKFLLTDRWEFIALQQLIVINASILSMHKFLLINLWVFIYVVWCRALRSQRERWQLCFVAPISPVINPPHFAVCCCLPQSRRRRRQLLIRCCAAFDKKYYFSAVLLFFFTLLSSSLLHFTIFKMR